MGLELTLEHLGVGSPQLDDGRDGPPFAGFSVFFDCGKPWTGLAGEVGD